MSSNLTNITVLGAGVLGHQIAFQAALHGFAVTAYDVDDAAVAAARQRFSDLAATYEVEVPAAKGRTQEVLAGLKVTSDLADAVHDADLVIEAAPELPEVKQALYRSLSKVLQEKTILATNSSTLLPSDLVGSTDRPDRFLALHFANRIWQLNTAEVMGTDLTDRAVFDRVVAFAEEIGMVSIPIRKEKAGYVLNSMLVPFLASAAQLAAEGYAIPADVDKVWTIGTGAALGPFQLLDIIGLVTPYNIFANGDEAMQQIAAWMKEEYIDRGKLGVATGAGFYTYEGNQ
ncbi:3-hydroxyacyl-CoA dehydrogenase [Nocardia sp. NPDC059228]|uniref:3-hydroxyacyl-CoA dehydrogenase n=1 Tax=Nocardia sp. NPDC059228 TaxID=3346777 RepID=UPI0036D1662E